MLKVPHLIYTTLVLFISNFIVRIIGFLYKIYLSNKIGPDGLGVFHIIFNFLMLSICITTTGIPVALSSLISKEKSLNNKHNINIIFISTLYLSFFISLIISIFVSLNAKLISLKLLHSLNYEILILSISPAISLITISNILRNYYYGLKKVEVPAIGQILEQICRILFVVFLFMYINKPNFSALIPLLALSFGEIANIIFITVNLSKEPTLSNSYSIHIKEFIYGIKRVSKMAIPITFNRVFSVIIESVSSMIIPSRLVLSGLTYKEALSVYGTLTGMVFPFLFLPFTLTSALVVNLVPSISQEVARKNYNILNKKIFFSLFISGAIGILSSIVFFFLGEYICTLVYKNELSGAFLKFTSISCFLMVLNHTFTSILNALEKEYICTINNIIGLLIELFCIYFLIPIKGLGIYGYLYGFIISSLITLILNVITLINEKKRWIL